jgi:hypothetical protein
MQYYFDGDENTSNFWVSFSYLWTEQNAEKVKICNSFFLIKNCEQTTQLKANADKGFPTIWKDKIFIFGSLILSGNFMDRNEYKKYEKEGKLTFIETSFFIEDFLC